jgi:sucrose-6-phosphate hydrolase SacC (GH32 family)
LKSGKKDPIIAFYTAAGGRNLASQQAGAKYTQCIAYSTDSGFTWKKYEHNPIISHFGFSNRDPYVFWHEPSQKWVMVLYFADGILLVLNSNNLLDWQEVELIHDFYECPNLLELPVDGNTNNKLWVIYGADGQYYIGDFNGKKFLPHNEEKYALFQGNTGYAASTFDNMPDDRCVQMSWARGTETPGMPFNQTMNFPVTLELKTLDEGVRLVANPIKEIESLHREEYIKTSFRVEGVERINNFSGELFHIKAVFDVADNQVFGLRVRGVDIIYDAGKKQLVCLGKSSAVKTDKDGKMRLEILVDINNIEIFANGGEVYMPMRAPLADKDKNISLIAKDGPVEVDRLEVYKLASIWK